VAVIPAHHVALRATAHAADVLHCLDDAGQTQLVSAFRSGTGKTFLERQNCEPQRTQRYTKEK
jgi:hypothetical protein